MRKFAEKFHPGDSIGFAYGLHHDTAHLHAHLALCSRTAKGRYVGCSTSRYSRSKPKRQMDLIKSWFGRENAVGENPSIYRGNGSRGAIREARATIVLATQAYTSIHSP